MSRIMRGKLRKDHAANLTSQVAYIRVGCKQTKCSLSAWTFKAFYWPFGVEFIQHIAPRSFMSATSSARLLILAVAAVDITEPSASHI